jgi:hypothetical protein
VLTIDRHDHEEAPTNISHRDVSFRSHVVPRTRKMEWQMIRARWRCSRNLARLVMLALALTFGAGLRAQALTDPPGAIEGTVSTQDGSVKLPGALVTVLSADGNSVSQQASGDDGRFTIPDLPAARYRVRASLDGFIRPRTRI